MFSVSDPQFAAIEVSSLWGVLPLKQGTPISSRQAILLSYPSRAWRRITNRDYSISGSCDDRFKQD
jgi:hypothetical protein